MADPVDDRDREQFGRRTRCSPSAGLVRRGPAGSRGILVISRTGSGRCPSPVGVGDNRLRFLGTSVRRPTLTHVTPHDGGHRRPPRGRRQLRMPDAGTIIVGCREAGETRFRMTVGRCPRNSRGSSGGKTITGTDSRSLGERRGWTLIRWRRLWSGVATSRRTGWRGLPDGTGPSVHPCSRAG